MVLVRVTERGKEESDMYSLGKDKHFTQGQGHLRETLKRMTKESKESLLNFFSEVTSSSCHLCSYFGIKDLFYCLNRCWQTAQYYKAATGTTLVTLSQLTAGTSFWGSIHSIIDQSVHPKP